MVALVGDGECTLRHCVVTLERSGDTPARAGDRGGVGQGHEAGHAAGPHAEQGPKLTVESCFLRGDGDLLWSKASRPFALDVKKTFAALSGSLLNIEVVGEAMAPPDSQKTQVALQDTTTYLGGPLVR